MAFKNIDPLTLALGGMLGGGGGLAGIGGVGGMDLGGSYDTGLMDTGFTGMDTTTDTTGYDIISGDNDVIQPGITPMDTTPLYDTPYETPYDVPWHGDPYPDNTPTEIPPLYDPPPPPTPTSPPTDIDTVSITPPASPGQIPQFSMPNFAYNFPMPNINPLMGGPNMGPVGFYSVNSGAAGLPVPAYGGIENPNMLSNYVQQFVGGPDVLTRSLLG